jgi:flagellar basal body-associated protein FliL
MEKTKKKRKKIDSSVLWGAVAILLIVEIMSCAMLFGQLSSYSKPKVRNYISLTEASDKTKVEITRKTVAAMYNAAQDIGSAFTTSGAATFARSVQRELAPETDKPLDTFIIEDKDKIWTAHTEVEIFKISYDNNGDAVITVNSDGTGEVKKLIAPGTNYDYEFTLKNTGDKPLDYTLIFESWFEGTDEIVPVEAKVFYNEDGQHYLLGAADEWKPVLDLNGVTRDAGLNAGNICDYTLQWQWPFERHDGEGLDANDAFDTMLGNLAADGEELTLTIVIKTVAWVDEEPCTTGENPPQTGDDRPIILWIVIAITALAAIIFLPLFMKRREREEAQEA